MLWALILALFPTALTLFCSLPWSAIKWPFHIQWLSTAIDILLLWELFFLYCGNLPRQNFLQKENEDLCSKIKTSFSLISHGLGWHLAYVQQSFTITSPVLVGQAGIPRKLLAFHLFCLISEKHDSMSACSTPDSTRQQALCQGMAAYQAKLSVKKTPKCFGELKEPPQHRGFQSGSWMKAQMYTPALRRYLRAFWGTHCSSLKVYLWSDL